MNRQNIGSQFATYFQGRGLLAGIIITNLVIWILGLGFGLIDYLFVLGEGHTEEVELGWLALSSNPLNLLYRPWTLLSYMFVHAGLWHLLFNMLMLYFAGSMCYRYLGGRRFGWIYFLGGLVGGLLYLLCYSFFPVFRYSQSMLVGASAGVLAVFFAIGAFAPDQPVAIWPLRNFSIKMKWLVLILLLIDLTSIPRSNAGGHFAHLGGALWGLLYVYCMKKEFFSGRRLRQWRQKRQAKANAKAQNRHSRNTKTNGRPLSDEEYNQRRADDQKRMDAILDKISAKGYDSLSAEEKAYLFSHK